MSETMKFAFSNAAAPQWDFQTIAARAREYGYDGVTLHCAADEAALPGANVFLSDSEKLRAIFDQQKVTIACLAYSGAVSGRRGADHSLSDQVRRLIDRAEALGAPLVRMHDIAAATGTSIAAAAGTLATWLMPLADYAAERGVSLLIANTYSLRRSTDMWQMLETLSHPAVACAWDVLGAKMVGEPPSVSIPTLNQRLRQVIVRDAKLIDKTATLCQMGTGNAPIRQALTLLRGIGYRGWVSFDWPKLEKSVLDGPEETLPETIKILREWVKPFEPPAKPKPAPKAAAVKPAAAVKQA